MEITTSERALLGLFMAKIHRIDPDVLVVCLFMFLVIKKKLMNWTGAGLSLRAATHRTCYGRVCFIFP